MKEKSQNRAARRAAIQRQILLDGTVSVETLSQALGVSVATIRRDLTSLDKDGTLSRTHGGAIMSTPKGADQAFALREQIDCDAKRLIARAASELIEVDQTLFMNDGSTILALAREVLTSNEAITVATSGVNIATTLAESSKIQTYLAGGLVRHQTRGTVGNFVEQMLSMINADIAFIAAEGFSVNEGLTYSYEDDAAIARTMSKKAITTVVLATARKIEQLDRITSIPTSDVDILVTDSSDEDLLHGFRDLGIRVIVASLENYGSQNIQKFSA